jgi:hypothetical protein
MTIDNAVLSFAGVVVLAGLGLGWFVSPWWFLLTAFAGLNMLQAGFTGFCPAAMVFRRLGVRPGCAFS